MTIRTAMSLLTAALTISTLPGCPGPTADAPRPRRAQTDAPEPSATKPPPDRPRARPLPPATHLAGAHILIAYKGARRARPGVTRTKPQALALAAKLAALIDKAPKRFAELARKHSDGPTAKRGGFLGSWKKGRMVPAFDNALQKIRIGQTAGPVETPFGFHVLKRLPLPPRYAARHILISYKGALRARSHIARSKAQALALAAKLAAQLRKGPGQFAAFARQYSDGPSAARGGNLGTWTKGRMVPAFDAAVAKLAIGGISAPVETPFGYHIIRREPLPKPPAPRP